MTCSSYIQLLTGVLLINSDLEEDGEEYLPPGKRGRFSSSFSKEEQDQRLATYEKEVIVNDKGASVSLVA